MKLTLLISVGLLTLGAVCTLTEVRSVAKPVRPMHREIISPSVAADTDVPNNSAAETHASKSVTLRDCADRLNRGRDWLRTVPDYTAVFQKQERVGETLRPLEIIDLKLRHVPLSIAMSWRDLGRIAYFQENLNDNRMVVRMGGWKRRIGWIHLDPNATLALQEARYPITDVGLLGLTEQLLQRFHPYLDRPTGVTCTQSADEHIGGRRCQVFTVDYATEVVNPDYRRSLVWLDAEWSVPISVQNFDWSTSDPVNPDGMMEYYVYEDVQFRCELNDADFTVDGRIADGSENASVKP